MNIQSSQRSIDLSLARSIRRGYFRRLAREWAAYDQRRGRAAGRNVSLSAWMDTRRQFRERLGLLEKFAGPLLPACTLRIGRYERRMKRLQQAVSRKKRGSANRKRAVARLGTIHARIAAMRRDFLHQRTAELVRGHALIAIEDLAVKSMTASAAGTVEAPGKNVRAKAGLNRTILRNGWSMARGMLEYKAAWSGVMLMAVPPAYTSQACSACGFADAGNRPSQARFVCLACGHAEHADRNAAKNILRRAQEQLGGDAENEVQSGGRPTSTAGCAGTHACEGAATPRRRPRSAAQGASVGAPLAGTVSGLSLPGNLHP